MPTRRDFLIQIPLAMLGAAATSSLLHAQSSPLPNPGPAHLAPGGLAPLHFLTFDPGYSDYRPAIDGRRSAWSSSARPPAEASPRSPFCR